MPRKQRFKPSRKPKPIPQSEAAALGHDARSASSHGSAYNENVEAGGSIRRTEDDSAREPDTDQR